MSGRTDRWVTLPARGDANATVSSFLYDGVRVRHFRDLKPGAPLILEIEGGRAPEAGVEQDAVVFRITEAGLWELIMQLQQIALRKGAPQ